MKTKKIVLVSVLLLLLLCLMCTTKSYGICFDMYIQGEESVRAGDTIQLEAFYFIGNDLDEFGILREDDVTNKAIWTSSDENIAKVENGEVYGISRGLVTITAEYNDGDITREASMDVYVYGEMKDSDPNNTVEIIPDETIEYNQDEVVEYAPNDSSFSPICYAEEESDVYQDYNENNKIDEEIVLVEKSPVTYIDFLGFFRNMFHFQLY